MSNLRHDNPVKNVLAVRPGSALTPFETLFALALNLERGEMHVLDGFRVRQGFMPDRPRGLDPHSGDATIEWTLLGEPISLVSRWDVGRPRPGFIQITGKAQTKVMGQALAILTAKIAEEISKREGKAHVTQGV